MPHFVCTRDMAMIPVGADGEPRLDLLIRKPMTIANCEDYRKSKWDMSYHQLGEPQEANSVCIDDFVIQYNFLRNHTSLKGRTPAQATGPNLPIEKGWGDLIQWAAAH